MGNQFHRWLLALLAWPLLPLCGTACDCPYYGAPCKAFANTPTVFVGRVVKVSTIDRKTASGDEYKDRLVFFDVERSYRGWTAKTAEVVTGWGGGDCGYEFHEGVEYLVYGYPHRETGRLYTGICRVVPGKKLWEKLPWRSNAVGISNSFSPCGTVFGSLS